jgi:methylglyoxal synthase
MRLCDQWHVKRLMNRGSVMAWCDTETKEDKHRNRQAIPPSLVPRGLEDGNGRGPLLAVEKPQPQEQLGDALAVKPWDVTPKKFSDMTVALIAHDEMKGRMVEFAIDHEAELDKFKRILATGTTGREVAAATEKRIGDKMIRYHSGPKGGDVEIATAVLQGLCDVVIFFIDPLRPHPHIEDIRVVFQACMISEQVVMITNEVHAREFMSRVVREKEGLDFYESSDRDTDRI